MSAPNTPSRVETSIDAGSPRSAFDVRELWRFRELLLLIINRNVAVRYRNPALGALWALLQPLSLTAVFGLILGRLARLDPGDIPYPVFLFAGLTIWLFFSSTLAGAGSSVIGSKKLIGKVYFPRIILPLAAVGTPFVDFLVATSVVFAAVLYLGHGLALKIVVLPLLLLIATLTAVGVGSFFAALAVAYQDTRNVFPLIRTLWLFSTPVIWPPRLIPEDYRWIMLFNPMAGVVNGFRAMWFDTPIEWAPILSAGLVSMLLFWAGVRFFRAFERRFVDDL